MDLRGFENEEQYWETRSSASHKKKLLIPTLLLSLLASLFIFRGVFAANVNLNVGTNVEFGQGISFVTSCASQIMLTPTATFLNSQGASSAYQFSGLKLDGVTPTCDGVSFVIKAYDNLHASPLPLFESYTAIVLAAKLVIDTGTMTSKITLTPAIDQGTLTLTDSSSSTSLASATVAFGSPASGGASVYKITVQTYSSSSPQLQPVVISTLPAIQVTNGSTPCIYGGFGSFAGSAGWNGGAGGSGYFCSPFPNGTTSGVVNDYSAGLFYTMYGYSV